MVDAILQDADLFELVRYACEERGYCVRFASTIDPDRDMVLLKVDGYYNTKRFATPPPAIDYLAVLRRTDVGFCLVLIELRNVASTRGIDKNNIVAKFRTAIEDFMKNRFSYIFLNKAYEVRKLKLFFVTDPLGLADRGIAREEVERKYKATKLDFFNTIRPFEFRNHAARIEHVLPNPVLDVC